MTETIPEFHRPVSLDRVGAHGLDLTLEAIPLNALPWPRA